LGGAAGNALAITASGTSVTNTASVAYDVSSVAQTPATNGDTFTVDTRVDVNITKNADDNAFPNQTLQPLKFTVTNEGNDTFDFLMSIEEAGANPNALAATAIYQDDGTTVGSFNTDNTADTVLTASTIQDLAPGASVVLYIVSSIPSNALDTETYVAHLKALAQTSAGGTLTVDTGGDTQGGAAEIVFADAGGTATGDSTYDKTHSASGTYTIQGAALAVTKSSAVTTDGAGGTYYIPGATVEYTIDIANTGAQDATSVVVTDTIPAEMTYVTGSLTYGGASHTDAVDGDASSITGTTVTVNVGTIANTIGNAPQIKFQATID
ncbi:hypothetical protein ACFL2V_21335, partial [Pseudomonadota bacterium]